MRVASWPRVEEVRIKELCGLTPARVSDHEMVFFEWSDLPGPWEVNFS